MSMLAAMLLCMCLPRLKLYHIAIMIVYILGYAAAGKALVVFLCTASLLRTPCWYLNAFL